MIQEMNIITEHTSEMKNDKMFDEDVHDFWAVTLSHLSNNCLIWVNFLVSLLVVVHNIVIVRYLYSHKTDIASNFLFWIGIADIFAALSSILFFSSSTQFFKDLIDQIPYQRCIIIFCLIFPTALACSRALNVCVTMIKTINIAGIARRGVPGQFNKITVTVISAFICFVWLILVTSDMIINWKFLIVKRTPITMNYYYALLIILLKSLLVGGTTLAHLILTVMVHFFGQESSAINSQIAVVVDVAVISIQFFLPSIVTFVCAIVQARSIKSSLRRTTDEASHINTTIFLVTVLFCLCHSTNSVYILVTVVITPGFSYLRHHSSSALNTYLITCSFFEFTLPMLNAAIFPLIIIVRKQSLRALYREWFLTKLLILRRLSVSFCTGFCRVFIPAAYSAESENVACSCTDSESQPENS